MVWFCICTMTLTRATAPGSNVPAEQVMVKTPGPPPVQATGPFAATIFICGTTVTVPDTLFATGPAWAYVRLVFDGTVAIGNVPLKDGSATPAMVTVSPKANARGEVRVMVTLPLASREALAMLAGTVFTVSTTTTLVAGKCDVFVIVRLYVICAGVAVTVAGPAIVIVTVGTFAADGTTAFDTFDAPLNPAMLVACTVKVYEWPLVKPLTSALSVFEPKAGGGTVTKIAVPTPLSITFTV